jgi:hypothetical protein
LHQVQNFPGPVGTDPGGSEKYKHDFQHLQDRTFLGGELGFAIRTRLPCHRDDFLKIGGRTWVRFLPEISRNQPQNDLKRPQKKPQKGQNHPKRKIHPKGNLYSTATNWLVRSVPAACAKSETRCSMLRTFSMMLI